MTADRIDPQRDPAEGREFDGDETDRYNFEWDDEPGVFEVYDQAAEDAAIARAREDIAAGRLIPNELVMEWIKTWGTPEERPAPPEWLR